MGYLCDDHDEFGALTWTRTMEGKRDVKADSGLGVSFRLEPLDFEKHSYSTAASWG